MSNKITIRKFKDRFYLLINGFAIEDAISCGIKNKGSKAEVTFTIEADSINMDKTDVCDEALLIAAREALECSETIQNFNKLYGNDTEDNKKE